MARRPSLRISAERANLPSLVVFLLDASIILDGEEDERERSVETETYFSNSYAEDRRDHSNSYFSGSLKS